MNTVKCPICGQENKNTNIRCEFCGTELHDNSKNNVEISDSDRKKVKRIIRIILIVLFAPWAIVALAAIAGSTYLFITDNYDIDSVWKIALIVGIFLFIVIAVVIILIRIHIKKESKHEIEN